MKTMLMQIFGVTKKEHYGMLWYFLEWSIVMLKTILDSSAYTSDSSVEELWGRDWIKTMFFFCLFFVCFCLFVFFARALPPLLGGHDS